MANISSYPLGTPAADSLLAGTQKITDVNGVDYNVTRNFSVSDVATFATENYVEVTKTISNAQLTALQGTNVELIAPPGANLVIKVLEVSAYLDFNTAAFTFAQPLLIQYKDDGSGSAGTIATLPVAFAQLATDAVYMATPASGRAGINHQVMLSTSGAVGAGGATSMQIKIRYQVLNTSSF